MAAGAWEAPSGRAGRKAPYARLVVVLAVLAAVALVRAHDSSSPTLRVEPDAPPVERVPAWAAPMPRARLSTTGIAGGSLHVDADEGLLVALDTATGQVAWNVQERRTKPFGVAAAGDVVYVVGGDRRVRAYAAATGTPRWTFDPVEGRTMSLPPLVVDDTVYVMTVLTPGARVFALDASSGSERWRTDVVEPPYYGLAVAGHELLLGRRDGVEALDARDGHRTWFVQTASPAFPAALRPSGDSDGSAIASGHEVRVVTDGSVRWTRTLPHPVRGRPLGFSSVVVVTLWDGSVQALDAADGRLRWECDCQATTTPVAGRDVVVVGSRDGVTGINPSHGSRRWTLATGEALRHPPVATRDAVFVTTPHGVVRFDYPSR